ncbi:hypothetical protein [Tenacibaculum sp. 190524A02b]|uniref:alpha/beta fold hydrolase n=1 Tax=Tenacibaculum vairaonense TaxID=3137860 RepID=UPI0031FA7A18
MKFKIKCKNNVFRCVIVFSCAFFLSCSDDIKLPINQEEPVNTNSTIPADAIIPLKAPFKTIVNHDGLQIPVKIYGNQKSDIVIFTIHGGPGGKIYNGVSSNLYKDYLVISYLQRGDSGESYGVGANSLEQKLKNTTIEDMYAETNKVFETIVERYNLKYKKFFVDATSWGGWLMLQFAYDNKTKNKSKYDVRGLISYDGMSYSVKNSFYNMVAYYKETLEELENQYKLTKDFLLIKLGGHLSQELIEKDYISSFFNENDYGGSGTLQKNTYDYTFKIKELQEDGSLKTVSLSGSLADMENLFLKTLKYNKFIINKISQDFESDSQNYIYYEKLLKVFRLLPSISQQFLPSIVETQSKINHGLYLLSIDGEYSENKFEKAFENYLKESKLTHNDVKDNFRYILNEDALKKSHESIFKTIDIPLLFLKNKQDDIIPYKSIENQCNLTPSALLYVSDGYHGIINDEKMFMKYNKETKSIEKNNSKLKDIVRLFINKNTLK